jgi:hypothetical protein
MEGRNGEEAQQTSGWKASFAASVRILHDRYEIIVTLHSAGLRQRQRQLGVLIENAETPWPSRTSFI